ncbi:hypothetical protein F5144DRAFT_554818 [Chaetomium tenue]|uniref:Uncharacterized protein n=1 Tax=Chaetomium tenue TaxID=1854479 RepID=A0ACB7PQQ3_9PEZI|nr:hypothetical protein F5144DRAFT_554818 [Chaetomium globosum]
MGLDQDLRSNPPCHPRACAIQDCLTKNGYNEARCAKLVDALYECCQAFYEKNGDSAVTASCPKPNLLRLKMEQRKNGIQ